MDWIRDFNVAAGDQLDLRYIDANTATPGHQQFKQVTAFTGAGGEMVRSYAGGNTTLSCDTDANGVADMAVLPTGDIRSGWVF